METVQYSISGAADRWPGTRATNRALCGPPHPRSAATSRFRPFTPHRHHVRRPSFYALRARACRTRIYFFNIQMPLQGFGSFKRKISFYLVGVPINLGYENSVARVSPLLSHSLSLPHTLHLCHTHCLSRARAIGRPCLGSVKALCLRSEINWNGSRIDTGLIATQIYYTRFSVSEGFRPRNVCVCVCVD